MSGGGGLAGVYDLRKEEDVREYLKNLGTEYTYQCYEEKLPDGCHRLADFYEAFRRDEPKAREILKWNCDKTGYGHSCYKYAAFNMAGRGGAKDHLTAYNYYVKGCEGGFAQSCHNAALVHEVGYLVKDKAQRDFLKAVEFYERSCDQGYMPSCNQLSTYYLTGNHTGVPKDLSKAFEYAEKACARDHMYACVNLSVMYKNGDGVKKNLELSKKYEAKARKLYGDSTRGEQTIKMSE